MITFSLPPELSPRNYNLRVETSNGLSNTRVFTLTGTPDCISCPAQAPVINTVEPPLGAPGAIITLHGQDFGGFRADRQVEMRQESPPGSGIYVWDPVPIYAWNENQIKFFIRGGSAWNILPYSSEIKVTTEKGGSNTKAFPVRKSPEIWNLDHNFTGDMTLQGV